MSSVCTKLESASSKIYEIPEVSVLQEFSPMLIIGHNKIAVSKKLFYLKAVQSELIE